MKHVSICVKLWVLNASRYPLITYILPDEVHLTKRWAIAFNLAHCFIAGGMYTARPLQTTAGAQGPIWKSSFYDHAGACTMVERRAPGNWHTKLYTLRDHCVIDRSTSFQHVSCGPLTSMFYGLDVMDCNVKPSLAEGLQMPQGAPQGENTKGTFVKGHLCAYLNSIV